MSDAKVNDGIMKISKSENSETVRIQQFLLVDKGVMLNEIQIELDYQTSTFAIAAMLKGLNEFYFKPAGMQGSEETLQQSEHNLKIWEEVNQKAKSNLILP